MGVGGHGQMLQAVPLPLETIISLRYHFQSRPSAACDNQSSVFLRWIATSNNAVNGSLASGGTSRIDDIAIAGFAPAFVAGYNNLTVNGLAKPFQA